MQCVLKTLSYYENITSLNISGNFLDETCLKLIYSDHPQRSKGFSNLKFLSMGFVGIDCTSAALLNMLRGKPNLELLDLSGNLLSSQEHILDLFQTLSGFVCLREIRLESICFLSPQDISLPNFDKLCLPPNLTRLIISSNSFTSNFLEALLRAVCESKVEDLDLSDVTPVNDATIQSLEEVIIRSRSLRNLNISYWIENASEMLDSRLERSISRALCSPATSRRINIMRSS